MLPLPDLSIKPDPAHRIAYLAGFFDGEGCIRLVRGRNKRGDDRYLLSLIVVQRYDHPIPLEMFHETFGGSLLVQKRKAGKNHNAVLRWRIYSEAAAIAVQAMLPHLTVKRVAAYAAVAFFHWKEIMASQRPRFQRLPEDESEQGRRFKELFTIINSRGADAPSLVQ